MRLSPRRLPLFALSTGCGYDCLPLGEAQHEQGRDPRKVLALLGRFAGRGAKEADLSESTTLDDLEVNSARMIDIILDLEDQFGVTIDDSSSPKLKTVGDVG